MKVVRLPDGSHWLVRGGVGHQITGTRQLFWARIIYGEVTTQQQADWEEGPNLLAMVGGPGGIEAVAKGETPDPFGYWLVEDSTPNQIFADARYVIDPDGNRFLLIDSEARRVTGEGQVRALDSLYGEPEPVDSTPDLIVGDLVGDVDQGALFGPNEIEVLSGTAPANQTPVDETADESNLPAIEQPAPITGVEPANPNAPSLRGQVEGETGDRTPGLQQNDIVAGEFVEPQIVADPTDPVDTAEGGGSSGEEEPPPPTDNAGRPYPQAQPQGRPQPAAPPGHHGRPNPPSIDPVSQAMQDDLDGVQSYHGRPQPTSPSYQSRPTVGGRARSLRSSKPVPRPSYPSLRKFLSRTGLDADWLDRVEGKGR